MEYEVGQSRDVVGYAAGGTTEDFAYLPEPQGIVLKIKQIEKFKFTTHAVGRNFFINF